MTHNLGDPYEQALVIALLAALVSGSPSTLELIAQTIAAKHGTLYAERWLTSQNSKQASNLPSPQRASEWQLSGVREATAESLSEPVRLFPAVSPTDIVISPAEALRTALERLEGKAEARAEKLRERTGFNGLNLRSDRRRRLERFHNQLVLYALVVASKRGYRKACTLTVHTVMELVGYCLGIKSSSTLYSYLHVLKGLGLLDFRGHVTTITLPGEGRDQREVNRCDGALLCVRLGGCKMAKLSRFDFAETPRDLQGDIERGHTAFRLIRKIEESLISLESEKKLEVLVLWSLNPAQLFSRLPLENDPSDFKLLVLPGYPTEIFDVVGSKNRNQAVGVAAGAMARALGDVRSLSFYQRLLWQLLRAHDRGWDFFGVVYQETVRVLADKREGFARKSGALLISRLKKSGCWEELWRDQDQWVGRPVVA